MTFPLDVQIGSLRFSTHLVCEVLSFFLGFRYFMFLRKRQTDVISEENRVWIIIGAAFGAFIGSRLLGALERPDLFFGGQVGGLYYFQNKTIIGGLLGGVMGVEGIKKIVGERHSSGDLFTFPLIFALIIGRIGCFSMGIYEETYGFPSNVPWAMDLGDGVLRHPTVLYEIVFLGLLTIGIVRAEKGKTWLNGTRFKLFMTAYLLYRFSVEFIRPGYRISCFTIIQIACGLALIYYIREWRNPVSIQASELRHEAP